MDFKKKAVTVREKGFLVNNYQISAEELQLIRDYIWHERKADAKLWDSPALFLPASIISQISGRLAVCVINPI